MSLTQKLRPNVEVAENLIQFKLRLQKEGAIGAIYQGV